MTHAEQTLADDKMRAEIVNLNALTSKLISESAKIQAEARWYPFVATAAVFGAALALAKYLL